MTHLPLFPLNVVLFPHSPLPLHIFEERYRLLIARCIEQEEPFGVVYQRGETIEQIGCTARIEQVLKRYDDGRLDIITVGSQRFSIESVDTTEPYLQGLVRFLDESEADSPGPGDDLTTRAMDSLLRYAYYAEREIDRDALKELSVGDLSFLIAGVDEMGLESKQRLLEVDASTTRLEKAIEALETVTGQLMAIMRLRKIVGDDVDMGSLKN
jgi:Lon protease-like protein